MNLHRFIFNHGLWWGLSQTKHNILCSKFLNPRQCEDDKERQVPLPCHTLVKKWADSPEVSMKYQCKQEPNERVRKLLKVGHKVGRALNSPKVSPTAASPKWFINSHEWIRAY